MITESQPQSIMKMVDSFIDFYYNYGFKGRFVIMESVVIFIVVSNNVVIIDFVTFAVATASFLACSFSFCGFRPVLQNYLTGECT